mmetsp:Transcript_25794/g.57936  ORF Transcript_25794/g.57936 Transcript_25794/m.57936 type:complete len:181 (-) Transcript_25794:587-1129(-)
MSKEPAFEGVDINHILNDKSLYNELIGLGWVDDSVPAPAPRAMAPRVAPPAATHAAAHADVDIPDISGIGMIDEHQMALTEDDLKDSDLLAEFEGLQNGDDGAWSMESDAAAETVDSVPALPVPAPKIAPAPAPAPLFLRRAAALRRTTSRLLYIWQYQKVGKGDVYLPLFSCRLPLGVE